MAKRLFNYRASKLTWSLRVVLVLCLLAASQFALSHWASAAPTVATDNFNRANGGLGSNWTATSDGGMSIASDQVIGTVGANTGDIRTAETYASNQYSQITVTSTPLSGGQWVGPAVRMQDNGQDAYVGLYYWNFGSPELMVFARISGGWSQLGSYNSGVLPAGTQLMLQAVGSTISFWENGVQEISVTDSNFTGGAPGIMAYGNATADNWSGQDVTSSGPPPSYTVGGTVSGLSGTLVLQDNGGDNLSLSANGSFTFQTPVASGGAYNVTVQSSPSGQSCTVANGSGTVAAANIANVAVSCAAVNSPPPTPGSDDFNRADGSLGPNWTPISDGGMSIASDQVIGTVGANTGDIRTAETYTSDQSSQITVTSTPLSGGQWVGPAVRMQDNGQDAYVGLYYWNFGSPEMMVFARISGGWSQLGSYNSGVLPAGTPLMLQAVGSTISFWANGVLRISVSNSTFTGGAPGIMAYGNATADNWSGQDATSGGATSYTVGGTVSGLSGTVALQDNGGDNLSLSANGSFTFQTPVASGGGYNVTVLSDPSGQSCTVANGSGTVAAANITNIAVSCAAVTSTPGSDDFNRANGSLGPNWTATSDGAMSIASDQVVGTAGADSGEIRTAETYASDQYSQITVTSTPLSGTQWVGPAVRMQDNGQDAYVGLYYWNSGSPEMMLFSRSSGSWNQLGSYSSGALPTGTQLRLEAVGNTIAFLENGVQRIAVSDNSFTGGAPGIMASGAATADNWSGGAAGFQVSYQGTSAGIQSYSFISANDGYGPQTLRVLTPTAPAAGVAHNFLIVLPVEAGLGSSFGDGLATLQAANAQNQYNLTIIEPTFAIDSWYANNPNDPDLQYETFMTQELVPWIKQNLATTGDEQIWLIGFSKSGLGAQDLILKHPDLFTLAASWDFPADMATYNGLGSDPAANYGTDANYQANYRLTGAFVDNHAAPLRSSDRIWIGGYSLYQTDVSDYGALLTAAGIKYSVETPPQYMTHRWDSGWMPLAMAALYQDSLNQN